MDSTKSIDINELRRIINCIFDHITNDLKIDAIDLQHDYYNQITLQEQFNPMQPPDLVMGQLYDDWEFLRSLLNNETDECVSLMFDHVVPLLRYIAFRVGQ